MQKLIDKLELYPAKDLIPSELADKILAVYQINADDIAVNIQDVGLKKVSAVTVNTLPQILTVPTGKVWQVKWGNFIYKSDATIGNRAPLLTIKDDSGNVMWRAGILTTGQTASRTIIYNLVSGLGVQQTNSDTYLERWFGIPEFLVLPAGYSINVTDESSVSGTDDIEIRMIVNEIDE